jgi:hypothetical protein
MDSYYVVFHRKNLEIYLTWQECSKQVLGVRNSIYKKYSTYEQTLVSYHASLRDFNAPVVGAPPLPPDLPQDSFQGIPPADGKAGY